MLQDGVYKKSLLSLSRDAQLGTLFAIVGLLEVVPSLFPYGPQLEQKLREVCVCLSDVYVCV